jgi:hypothetical protein
MEPEGLHKIMADLMTYQPPAEHIVADQTSNL